MGAPHGVAMSSLACQQIAGTASLSVAQQKREMELFVDVHVRQDLAKAGYPLLGHGRRTQKQTLQVFQSGQVFQTGVRDGAPLQLQFHKVLQPGQVRQTSVGDLSLAAPDP